jgi:hypothetical protein
MIKMDYFETQNNPFSVSYVLVVVSSLFLIVFWGLPSLSFPVVRLCNLP